jgi:esterase/lipase superfamily enzyme
MRRIAKTLIVSTILFASASCKRETNTSGATYAPGEPQKQKPGDPRAIPLRPSVPSFQRESNQESASQSSEADQGSITGVVKSLERPVVDALVELWTQAERVPIRVKTDVNGKFIFVSLKAGRYNLSVLARGSLHYATEVSYDGQKPETLAINLQPGTTPIADVTGVRVVTETIFYATDRNAAAANAPVRFYDNDYDRANSLGYGRCEVSLPERAGATSEEVMKAARELGVDALVYPMVQGVMTRSKSEFLSEIKRDSGAAGVLIFVHGFKNSFVDATEASAALRHDLHFQGPVILYSWPSMNDLSRTGYQTDTQSAAWSAHHFSDFLDSVRATDVKIHVVAHSMGNQLVMSRLDRNPVAAEFERLIFVAPDVDAGVFASVVGQLSPTAHQLTMYTATWDWALGVSHRWQTKSRAGETTARVILPQVDTIDATDVDTSLVGHSYYASSPQVQQDIELVLKGQAPPRLHLLPQSAHYWKLAR